MVVNSKMLDVSWFLPAAEKSFQSWNNFHDVYLQFSEFGSDSNSVICKIHNLHTPLWSIFAIYGTMVIIMEADGDRLNLEN